ncbi:MAG TPA: FHA domain-containing protein, partial [Bacteroidota bacterium]|nr:FHA domain-containing protein [Bacteroidota bacterium]
MFARLFCKTGQLTGVSCEIKDEVTIGKGTGNTLQLDAAPISTKHARIFFDTKANSYIIEDLGSRNGTRLDGVRVREKERLGQLHIITFAEKYDFIFQLRQEDVKSSPSPAKTSAPAQPVVSPPAKAPEKIE